MLSGNTRVQKFRKSEKLHCFDICLFVGRGAGGGVISAYLNCKRLYFSMALEFTVSKSAPKNPIDWKMFHSFFDNNKLCYGTKIVMRHSNGKLMIGKCQHFGNAHPLFVLGKT